LADISPPPRSADEAKACGPPLDFQMRIPPGCFSARLRSVFDCGKIDLDDPPPRYYHLESPRAQEKSGPIPGLFLASRQTKLTPYPTVVGPPEGISIVPVVDRFHRLKPDNEALHFVPPTGFFSMYKLLLCPSTWSGPHYRKFPVRGKEFFACPPGRVNCFLPPQYNPHARRLIAPSANPKIPRGRHPGRPPLD